ncbi:4-hydroxy-3-methylbut-2-enyl diphosphate reductase [Thermosipho melanesiensis]|uniref:Hydroxymethylbutenyl pyrophosphate reductase n=2 Tax=Thermosipho melanesiensis TaxID=46541 RepID=A6LNG6_THEM4|nr:bifunctional 4-hydroxy-3-methylbut-2-enyl diphosphate reductase/30S ribosomal protein S1 [Thermosipho melanesiensis]ABR31467.1 hydroxymethylbutenyl pyrophosphate reductase [Thermosipho melanesiensis BI429]APT74525.1 4-hydroxy-3-methylbut-2-enyl diphosphate reductase [Thermosipho melanesiensis]OOC36477.1 4-hydroxy-3-methylbut-2-enyl diphosphate reductase [Thermosipho melanesiensis]OOC37295.1 4-hydroxy-3-methylbut-2-enyl diphosphate reductase [Thermosipho melanesiensis]OOC38048.1 4-hydroxy-3-
MQIVVAEGIGFCFGVENAVSKAKELLKKGLSVWTDDDIVHNKSVMKELYDMGLSKEKGDVFLVRAHGLPKDVLDDLKKRYKVEDLTCSIVKNLFKTVAEIEKKGYKIVVFGKKEHPEMKALKSYCENATITDIPLPINAKRIAIASQTTMSYTDFEFFVNKITEMSKFDDIKIINSICNITYNREKEAEKISKIVDLMVVVGGKHSSNTTKLYKISSKYTKSMHIELPEELIELPKGVKKIGVISGTSTPKNIVEKVILRLKELGGMLQMDGNFEKLLESYLYDDVRRGTEVMGTVLRKGETELFVNFGWRAEGIVSSDELVKDLSEYNIGDKLKLLVIKIDEEDGMAFLSEKRVYLKNIRNILREKFEKGEKVIGKIISRNKGGYDVLIDNVFKAFLPKSESMIYGDNIPDYTMEFKIIKFEDKRKLNVVVSRKALVKEQVERFFKERKKGDIVEGIVKRIEDFGAFVRVAEGIEGLLPNSEVSYDYEISAMDVLGEGQSVKLYLKEIDPTNKKLIFSLKELMPNPWNNVEKKYKIGEVVSGKVKKIMPYGFFVNLEPGIDGFVHIDDVFWGKRGNIKDIISEGDFVKLVVKEIDKENKKIRLSYKEVKGDPWENIEEKYPLGNVVTGIVRVVFDKGVIIDIEEGISGYCPISEISWNYISHPTDVIGEGNKVKAVVLDLDKENRKIRLSIKRTVENPWEKFKQQHKVGDIIKVKLVKELKNGYSANVEGIEVYVPKSHIVSDINVSDDLEVKIINIKTDGEILRVVVSEKEKENEKVLDEIKNEAEKERYTSIERKVKNGDSSDSGEE